MRGYTAGKSGSNSEKKSVRMWPDPPCPLRPRAHHVVRHRVHLPVLLPARLPLHHLHRHLLSGLPSFQSRNICSIGHRQLCLLILTCCRTSACALGEPRSVTPQPVANPVIPSKSLLAQLERPLLGLGRQIGLQTIYIVKKIFS